MSSSKKNQKAILDKLGIEQLNPMQQDAKLAIHSAAEVVVLSPTGTGKTLAFLLPVIHELDKNVSEVQVVILAPSRELAIQIEQVTREMGTGYKINAAYGGTSFSKDKIALKTPPSILIGTPGRIADHLRRKTFNTAHVKTLVLDEFDKSLEVGFEDEMKEIIEALPQVEKKVLTSATYGVEIPEFVGVNRPIYINYLDEGVQKLVLKRIISPEKDKLQSLVDTLCHLGNQPGIIFCNYKDSIQRVSNFLTEKGIAHGCFYGGLEQKERERALIKFRNGTHQIIIATDLAARGIDIPELKFIIHYHLPQRAEEFIHRNGRTARMHNEGTAYVLQWVEEELPDFIQAPNIEKVATAPIPKPSGWSTLFISGGRKDKVSKGDIAGLFYRQGDLKKDELGSIELKQDCAFVAIPTQKMKRLVELFDNSRLKKKKIRVYEI